MQNIQRISAAKYHSCLVSSLCWSFTVTLSKAIGLFLIALLLCFVCFELVMLGWHVKLLWIYCRWGQNQNHYLEKKKKKVWDIWFGYFFPLFSAIWWFASNVPSCWLPIEVSRFINNWIDFQYGLLLPWKKVFSREIGSSLFIYFLICIYLEGSTNPFLSYPI